MSREDYRFWTWLLAAALGVSLFLLLTQFLGSMSRTVEIAYARNTFFQLQEHRDHALRSDVSEAAERLLWVSEGTNTKQRAGSPLDRICTFQRTNVIHDIIIYLRAKTGEDLGDKPEPWIQKYAPKR